MIYNPFSWWNGHKKKIFAWSVSLFSGPWLHCFLLGIQRRSWPMRDAMVGPIR